MSNFHGSHDRHSGHSVAMFRDKLWLSFALTIPVVLWSTEVQHWLGYQAPSFVVAFGTSLAATFGPFEIEVWWELASLITIMVLGHWLKMRAISQASGALNALAALLPDTVERVIGAGTVASGGSLRVRSAAVGEQTALSGIMGLVAAAQASGSRWQALAGRAAAILFYVAIAAGAWRP
jgi:P-type Cu2+ transporter